MSRKKILCFSQDQLIYCCGVDEVGDFDYYQPFYHSTASEIRRSKTGLLIATFNQDQRKEKTIFKRMVNVLYETRRKSTTGNTVFLIVAECKKPTKKNAE